MRIFIGIVLLILLTGCGNDELSWISVKNETSLPIYIMPYASDYTNGEWIQPGLTDEFYSAACDCLDGYSYFSLYYDSLIVFLKDHDDVPIKFYKDGSTVNYDPDYNPFTNPEVWKVQDFEWHIANSGFTGQEENHVYEHYFIFEEMCVTVPILTEESDPAS